MAANDVELAQGEDKTIALTVENSAGAPFDLTGRGLRFTVRTKGAHQSGAILITKSSAVPAEILVTNAVGGLANIFIDPADTLAANGVNPGNFIYDIWLIDTDASQFQITESTPFRVRERVTVI